MGHELRCMQVKLVKQLNYDTLSLNMNKKKLINGITYEGTIMGYQC